jgi:MHS family proline/betaine transporter-like MFS transporter
MAVFAAAFFVRPLGGMILGSLGDRIGRQRTLTGIILLMSIATFTIGMLPGYGSFGLLAPVLLVPVRLLQGFATGGGFSGASTLLAEFAPPRLRGLYTSWAQASALPGLALGLTLTLLLRATLTEPAFVAWAGGTRF